MTPIETAAIRERAEKAGEAGCARCDGKGKFAVDAPTTIFCPSCQSTLTEAKEDVLALLDEVARLQQEVEARYAEEEVVPLVQYVWATVAADSSAPVSVTALLARIRAGRGK